MRKIKLPSKESKQIINLTRESEALRDYVLDLDYRLVLKELGL